MTRLSRRTVLGAAGLGAAVTPVLGGTAQAVRPRVAYSRARFRPHVRRRFTVRGPAGRFSVRLLEITDLSPLQRGDDQAFGLVFRARRRGPEQGTYAVRRHLFAPIELFLVPTDDRRRTYYAVVNRTA